MSLCFTSQVGLSSGCDNAAVVVMNDYELMLMVNKLTITFTFIVTEFSIQTTRYLKWSETRFADLNLHLLHSLICNQQSS